MAERELAEEFAHDSADPIAIRAAETRLSAAFAEEAKRTGLRTTNMECRSKTCRAKLEWDDLASAQRGGQRLASVELTGPDCHQTVSLSAPSESDEPWTGKLFVGCGHTND